MRNLVEIIDKIIIVAPELEPNFRSLRESVMYSSPEMMGMRWHQMAEILNSCAENHPEEEQIDRIFSGLE